MAALILLSTLRLSAATRSSSSELAIATQVVERRPSTVLMVPCRRAPVSPPDGAGQKDHARYVEGLITAGESRRRVADQPRDHRRRYQADDTLYACVP